MNKIFKFYASFPKVQNFYNFCLPELRSLFNIFGVEINVDENYHYDLEEDPLISFTTSVDLAKEDLADKICKRAVLIKEISIIYAEALSYPDLLEYLDKNKHLIQKELDSTETFKFNVDFFGGKYK